MKTASDMIRLSACLAFLLAPLPASAEGLSGAQVKNAMRPYMQAVRNCVERQSELDSSVSGRMDLSFTIGNRGRVARVEVLTPEHVRTYVAGCVGGVVVGGVVEPPQTPLLSGYHTPLTQPPP